MKKGEGKILSYLPEKGVTITGFDKLTDKDLDVLNNISHIEDPDNKRSYYRKKKSTKSKSKRKLKKKAK